MNLQKLLKPEIMAVVGISHDNPLSPGRIIFIKNYFEMDVEVYGIHPDGGEIEGVSLYKSLKELPKTPDLLVIAVPAEFTAGYMQECADQGIDACIIISGGFAEIGEEGKKRQDKIVNIATENEIAVLGPNCIGVYSPPLFDTIFMPTERIKKPPKGSVALISQSGGVLVDQFFHKFNQIKIGVSTAVSIGNRTIVDETMLLEYFSTKDDDTSNIAFYLESIKPEKSRDFLEIARNSTDDVIVYFGGLSERGKKATQSHTASLSGNKDVLQAALKQHLIIQPRSEFELLTYLKLLDILSNKKKPFDINSVQKGSVAILSLSGGHGVICADLLKKYGLSPVDFNQDEMDEMKGKVSSAAKHIASYSNPIDLTGSAEDGDVAKVLRYISGIEKVECIIVLILPYTPSVSFQIGRRIANTVNEMRKPVVCFIPYIPKYNTIIEALELSNIPVFHNIEEAVQGVSLLKELHRIKSIKKRN